MVTNIFVNSNEDNNTMLMFLVKRDNNKPINTKTITTSKR